MFCPYNHNDCYPNNNKGSTICLRKEINETDNMLNSKQNSETKDYEKQYEVRIEQQTVNIKDCVII